MSIRIYALAKELKIDSKALVDICNRIGIPGKGSALASLNDEEVVQLKSHLAGGKKGGAAAAATAVEAGSSSRSATTLRREDYIGPAATATKKIPVLGKKKLEKPAAAAAPPVEEPPLVLEEEAPPELEPVAQEPEAAPEAPVEIAAEAAPVAPIEEPEEPVVETPAEVETVAEEAAAPVEPEPAAPEPPRPASARPRALEKLEQLLRRKLGGSQPTERKGKGPAKPTERTGPAIKLAPLPPSKQPPPSAAPSEPAPQKPDMRLAPDAIRASKAGAKPLQEHLRKQEEKRKAAAKKKEPAAPADEASRAAAAGRDRGRRPARPGEKRDEDVGLGGREQRQLRRKKTPAGRTRRDDEDGATRQEVRRLHRTGHVSTAAPRKSSVVVQLPCTVRTFAESLGLPAQRVQGKMLELGTLANINDNLDREAAELLADALGVQVSFREPMDLEELVIGRMEQPDADENLLPRPPIVTFLGHVDHGKTSLLDRIIGIDVAAHEKGGITQHIRAYQVEKDGRAISFVDTPGHEAFTAMRARGANVTDIAVLVVAADDGVMPQTEEAISHARAAGVPIVVALNKIDLPGVNIERVMEQLARNDLLPSEWGGDVEVVRTSAVKGDGIEQLLDTLLTVAELHELKANPDRPASGVCLESEVQPGRGVVAKMLVQRGTLRVGDVMVCGAAHGRVKAMYDTLDPHRKHEAAGPTVPVNLTGLDVAPNAGDRFHALEDITEARQIAEKRAAQLRQRELGGVRPHITLENLSERISEQEDVQNLNIILRADTRGSIEAIRKELGKLQHPEVQVKVLQATVGGVTEADVHLADASDAVIIGFNVVADEGARALSDQLGVQIRRYDIIYQVSEDLKAALEGMLKPERQEVELGRALVQRTFHISRMGTIAGCRVLAGNIHRDSRVRVIRENRIIGDYPLESLKREKDDAREVREGLECGMKLSGFNDIKEGDILEAYKIEEVARTF